MKRYLVCAMVLACGCTNPNGTEEDIGVSKSAVIGCGIWGGNAPAAIYEEYCGWRPSAVLAVNNHWLDVGYSFGGDVHCDEPVRVDWWSQKEIDKRCDQYEREGCSSVTGFALLYEGTWWQRKRRFEHQLLHHYGEFCHLGYPPYGYDQHHWDEPRWVGFHLYPYNPTASLPFIPPASPVPCPDCPPRD